MKRNRALFLRSMIVKASACLEDKEALEAAELFPIWESGVNFQPGDRVRWQGVLWKCLMAHSA